MATDAATVLSAVTAADVARVAAYAAAGLLVGLGYFRALAAAVAATLGNGSKGRIVALHAARIGAAVAVFWAISTQGAAPLLAAFAGFLAARLAARRWTPGLAEQAGRNGGQG